ncbi:MAG: glycosyltransferase [Bacilli bacterium]|nr:glycosyltransferase [Bacilli bacterium]
MSKNCILFLYQYPFQTSEPFMETEIRYLCERFAHICIFSVNIKPGAKMTRTIPDGVEAFPLDCGHKKISNVIRGLFTRDDPFRHSVDGKGLKRHIADLYTRGRFHHVYKKAKTVLAKTHFDCTDVVIYSYWLNASYAAILLRDHIQKQGGVATAIARAHGYDLYAERNALKYLPYQGEYVKALDKVYPVSEDGRVYLVNKYPACIEKFHVARLGTKDHGIAPIPPADEFIFVTCSRYRKLKRLDLFARAFALLKARHPKVTWVCIGDGEEKDELFALFETLGIRGNMLITGRMPNEKVLQYYQDHPLSYFVNVSSMEGVPVSIMEAMSFGLPCIATDVGGTGEIVNGENGLLLPENLTPESLFSALEGEMRIGHKSYLKKRAQARKTWENHCAAEKTYRQWADSLIGS